MVRLSIVKIEVFLFKLLFIYSYIFSLIPTCRFHCTGRLFWGIDSKVCGGLVAENRQADGYCKATAALKAVPHQIYHWKQLNNQKWLVWYLDVSSDGRRKSKHFKLDSAGIWSFLPSRVQTVNMFITPLFNERSSDEYLRMASSKTM